MLSKLDLKQNIDKKAYKDIIKGLHERMTGLQLKIIDLKIPVTIVFEGWSASGKGTFIGKVLYPLDPRYFNVFTMDKVNEEAAFRPFLWSFATKMPFRGRITIFDKSWHRLKHSEGSGKWNLTEREKEGFNEDVNAFEKTLIADGNVIIKLFLHISKEEQKKRFAELLKNSGTKWRVDAEDLAQNEDYDKQRKQFEKMIDETSVYSKWHLIEAEDKNFATVKIFQTITGVLEEAVSKAAKRAEKPAVATDNVRFDALSGIELNKDVSDNEYREKLAFYQNKIAQQGFKLYDKRKSVVIVFEGWDASGKGGNIKRLTQELDPRGYEVIPIAAPTAGELNRHYLWRFWNKLPKDGHVAIFDRSWYGRVMVERIEGFCTKEEWRRAYDEINEMEKHLSGNGTEIFKFWLQIDKEEQLARFTARQNDPLKRYKITDEDWRNREKWDRYEQAVNEMLVRTSTHYAKWTIVESNSKKFARIKTLEIVTGALDKALQ